jgi:hypothetical protein
VADPLGSATATRTDPRPGIGLSVRPHAFDAQPTALTMGDAGYAVASPAPSVLGYDLVVMASDDALGYLVRRRRIDGGDSGVVSTAAGFQVQTATELGDELDCDVFFVFASDTGASSRSSATTSAAPGTTATSSGTSDTVVGLTNTGTGTGGSAPPDAVVSVGSGHAADRHGGWPRASASDSLARSLARHWARSDGRSPRGIAGCR